MKQRTQMTGPADGRASARHCLGQQSCLQTSKPPTLKPNRPRQVDFNLMALITTRLAPFMEDFKKNI